MTSTGETPKPIFGPNGKQINLQPELPDDAVNSEALINLSIRMEIVEIVVSEIAQKLDIDVEEIIALVQKTYQLDEDEVIQEGEQ